MNTAIKLALGAAAVVVVSFLGINLLSGPQAPLVGGASPAPSASPSPDPSPDATPVPTPPALPADWRPVLAGEYYVPISPTLRAVITVPAGMRFNGLAVTNEPGYDPPAGSFVSFWIVRNITSDPCAAEWLEPPVGGSVDDLVNAFADRPDFVAGSIEPATIDGRPGTRLLLSVPEGVDFASCAGGEYSDWTALDGGRRSQGPGQIEELIIVDVDGQRVMVNLGSFPGTSAEDLARLDSIVESIRFVAP